jgi:DNA-binding transcriptional MerR regulator
MAWSIAQVARMSKVTSRTLRHYDEIGLLAPARVGANGYRYYERAQLLALQEILVLRELGLGLDAIAEIVHEGRDQAEALRLHRTWLLAERDRFQQLADTVSRTITELDGGGAVSAKSMDHWFEGFDSTRQTELAEEARRRWGTPERVADRPREWWQDQRDEWEAQLSSLVELIDAGHEPADGAVQEVVANHYRWITRHWTPNRESYTGLGDLYAEDPRFRTKFDRTDPRLARFLRAAMTEYARANLD